MCVYEGQGPSKGLVMASGVVEVVPLVVKVVGLMAMMAVADDWMFDAFTLKLLLLLNSLQFHHKLFDEDLRMNTATRAGFTWRGGQVLCKRSFTSFCMTIISISFLYILTFYC